MNKPDFKTIYQMLQAREITPAEARVLLNDLKIQAKGSLHPPHHGHSVITGEDKTTGDNPADIAIIGISGQFPDAVDVNAFWENLIKGVESIHELPAEYFDHNRNDNLPDAKYCKWGGILEERDCFDPLFFNISPREAESMNPHQRLILQESWKALEDAGYNPKELAESQVGIMIGAEPAEYVHESFTGASDAIIASRLSYFLNLNGPALVVNTGCSSSGVAIHLACESLRNGESALTIAGGVFVNTAQPTLARLSDIGMLSPSGKCHPFDESADGTVLSEGVGVVVLKRLGEAIADSDHIYGVIKGSGINQDGASNGITAPNGVAQERLITDIYKKYQIDPEEITYFEAHGTGTKLGDPVEVNALVRAFKQLTAKEQYCALGSVKSNIGHTGAAAGVISLIKILLSLKYHLIPGQINYRRLNPFIELNGSAFYVNTESSVWKPINSRPLMAALNSFGHSGTNVHLVIQEYAPGDESSLYTPVPCKDNNPVLIPFSAKNIDRLKEYTAKFLKFLKEPIVQAAGSGSAREISRRIQDELERRLRLMLSEILQVVEGEIEIGEQFHDYGVTLIHLMQFRERIQKEWGIETTWEELYENSSITAVARYLIRYHIISPEPDHQRLLENPTGNQETKIAGNDPRFAAVDLKAVAYTLQTGREAMEERAIFSVRNIAELVTKLEAFQAGKQEIDNCWQGRVSFSKNVMGLFSQDQDMQETLEKWNVKGKVRKIAELWSQGFTLDWDLFYKKPKPQRLSLPTYPFEKRRFWKPGDAGSEGNNLQSPAIGASNASGAVHAGTSGADTLPQSKVMQSLPATRKMCLLKKQWEECFASPTRRLTGTVAILATEETLKLAAQLSKRFPSSHILDLRDLESRLAQPEQEWKNYAGCVDLTGCGRKKNDSLDWLEWLQRLIEYGPKEEMVMLCVTRGLELYQNTTVNLCGALRAGLYRMLQSEYTHFRSRHLDVEASIGDKELAGMIAAEFLTDRDDVEVCYRSGQRYRSFMEEVREVADEDEKPLIFPEDHVLWITGGTRGLGLLCARYFVTYCGARRLALMGRVALPPKEEWDAFEAGNTPVSKKIRDIRALEAQGAQIEVMSVALTDAQAVRQSVQDIKNIMGPIGGVIHCAGLGDAQNPALIRKSIGQIEQVLNPKVFGLDILYNNLKNEPLQFFVLFSSVSAVIPALASGQSDYAMANAYMDYFAASIHAAAAHAEPHIQDCPVVSIEWPNWKETGMGEVKSKVYEQTGLLSMTNEEGLKLLNHVLTVRPGPAVLPAVVDPKSWQPRQLMQRSIRQASSPVALTQIQNGHSMMAAQKGPDFLMYETQTWLVALLAEELKMDRENLNPGIPFQEFGLDSILLAQVISRMDRELKNVAMDPSALIEHPTIQSLSSYLTQAYPEALASFFTLEIEAQGEKAPPIRQLHSEASTIGRIERKLSPENETHRPKDKIAVVGMACHFPDATNTEEYWNNLRTGKDSIREAPKSRWDSEKYYYEGEYREGKSISKWGAYLTGIEDFDPGYFKISSSLAPQIDPLQRQWLEVSTEALADAGYGKKDFWGKRVGVFVGARTNNFAHKLRWLDKERIVGIGQNFIAAHLAHIYNFKGPNMVVDTACSSSLTAIHLAVKSIQNGESDLALAGGVDILLDESAFLALSAAKILSPDGRCKTFDAGANGIGLGEGCGVLVLKPLQDAIRDQDKIYGVIDGTAINNDGNTMGVTTPNPEAQKELIEAAIADGDINPATISYVETHGTGTLIGDPIELKALTQVFGEHTSKRQFCGVGSVKSNMGHLLSASGAASIIKVLLSIIHQELPPTLHCNNPNPRFNFNESPLYPIRSLKKWTQESGVLRAGISAFGLGGNNAHIIISNEGIPATHRATLEPKGDRVVFNRKRYWPEEGTYHFQNDSKDLINEAWIRETEEDDEFLRLFNMVEV